MEGKIIQNKGSILYIAEADIAHLYLPLQYPWCGPGVIGLRQCVQYWPDIIIVWLNTHNREQARTHLNARDNKTAKCCVKGKKFPS